MKKRVIPTVFAKNKKDFLERLGKLQMISGNLHIDLMDGKFVKSKGIKSNDIPDLKKYPNNFEAHLMLYKPLKLIEKLKQRGFRKVIFHYEACNHDIEIYHIINSIKSKKMEAWIAVNPETSIAGIIPFLKKIDGIMMMGVHPGKEHQNFVKGVYDKIKKIRKIDKKIKIQIDGGVNLEAAGKLGKLKVNLINSGSFVSNAINPKEALRKLEKSFGA